MKDALREAVEAEVKTDMTPMIDCVFLLIIFFLCIDFKILEAKLPAYLPKDVGSHSTDVEPQEKLHVLIDCKSWGDEILRRKATKEEIEKGKSPSYRLDGHDINWKVGPTTIRSLEELATTLEKVARDPTKRQKDPETGESKLMGVVLEPGPDTTYGDVAQTLDAVTQAGFDDVSFGGAVGKPRAKRVGGD